MGPDTIVDPAAPASVDHLLARLEGQAWRLERLSPIARGGMAVIELAQDNRLQRLVAMKLLSGEMAASRRAVANFIREAQITGQLDHPNVVPVHEIGATESGELYFTMKLVEGRTFAEMVESLPYGPLDPQTLFEALDVVVKVCDALALAHDRGVIHCDIKPENVMVGAFGQVYLMDWGIARLLDEDEQRPGEPVKSWVADGIAGGITGTPSFMAPEQALGRPLDERSDIFAVGALIYFLVTRRPPYQAESHTRTVFLAQGAEYAAPAELAPPGSVPEALNRLVLKAMAKRPEDRFRSVGDLRRHLVRFMRGGGEFPRAKFAAGDHIVREGEPADAAYIIVSGRCEVYGQRDGERVPLLHLGPGEVFGETAILASSPRTASVVALEPMEVLVITREVFEQEVDHMKPWMGAFTRTLARRFRERTRAEPGRWRATAAELCSQVLMYVGTWGEAAADGTRWTSWARLRDYLERLLAVEPAVLVDALRRYPEVELDEAQDRVAVRDAASLAASLRVELGFGA